MTSTAPIWTTDELTEAAAASAAIFREQRLAISDSWRTHYNQARAKFELLFEHLNDLNPSAFSNEKLAEVYGAGLGEALRYLAGPPISDDDLQVIANVRSLAPNVLKRDPDAVGEIFQVIGKVIDPYRFPWLTTCSIPTPEQKEAALVASSVLLASQRLATERRNNGKDDQERTVKRYLESLGFSEVPASRIDSIMQGPAAMQFCGESMLGGRTGRKADIVVRLHDTRLMAIECKVSNSETNSVKRLLNDAGAKAANWIAQFGSRHVVPVAMLAGVFKVLTLEQAQGRGLTLFWSHDLDQLGAFIESTRLQ